VIAVTDANMRIDFLKLAKNPSVHYDPGKYGGRVAYLKTKFMNGKVSVFNSGKLISVGAKSPKQAEEDLTIAINIIGESNVHQTPPVQIANIVFSVDLGMNLDLEKIATDIHEAIYEPEQFPAIILRFKDYGKASALIFSSGKIIINGVTSQEKAELFLNQIRHNLKKISGEEK